MNTNKIYKCICCGKPTTNDQSFKVPREHAVIDVHYCDECEENIVRQIRWENDNAHKRKSNIICPYCDYEMDDYDSFAQVEHGNNDNFECPFCHKHFELEIREIVEFSTHKRIEDMPDDWRRNKK